MTAMIRPVVAQHESAHVIVARAVGVPVAWVDARDYEPQAMLCAGKRCLEIMRIVCRGWPWPPRLPGSQQ
jgi:hypothetical protein